MTYHPDYLGNNEFISDLNGDPYQYFWYSAFGEAIISNHSLNGTYDSPWRFNGKEFDPETGNYYYGARYYDPQVSIWLSVDPLAHEFPWQTPYSAFNNNPITFVDPDGRAAIRESDHNPTINDIVQLETGRSRESWLYKPRSAVALDVARNLINIGAGTSLDIKGLTGVLLEVSTIVGTLDYLENRTDFRGNYSLMEYESILKEIKSNMLANRDKWSSEASKRANSMENNSQIDPEMRKIYYEDNKAYEYAIIKANEYQDKARTVQHEIDLVSDVIQENTPECNCIEN